MLKKERQEFILREINLHNKVLTSDLCEAINVSEDTIRRDLSELLKQVTSLKYTAALYPNHSMFLSKPMAFILMIIKR
jgi:DeoR/GlpR family transcriptional regulator of sugar metabolism